MSPSKSKSSKPAVLKELPPFPHVALLVLELLSDPDVETKEVVETLSLDSTFSAEMLRYANSSLFALPRKITTTQHAAIVLGHQRLRALTLTVAIRSHLMKGIRKETLKSCWWHSIACALMAEKLAPCCGIVSDLGYAIGLLHDIGRLALVAAYPKIYSQYLKKVQQEDTNILALEKEYFSLDHCEAGLLMAEEWKFPPELALAAARHHEHARGKEPLAITLARFSCQLANLFGFHAVRPYPSNEAQKVMGDFSDAAHTFWRIDIDQMKAELDKRINSLEFTLGLV